jgi:serine/threonine-protein kinase
VPVLALLVALGLAVGAVLALTGGGDDQKQAAAPAKKRSTPAKKKHKQQPKATSQPAPAQQQAPAPTQPAPSASPQQAPAPAGNYQVPQPSGRSAAEGWRLNNEGKQLSDRGDYAAAVPTLEKAARAYPPGTTAAGNLQFAYTLFNLGHALLQAGRPADAIPVLEERLKNPDQRGTVQAELDAARQAASKG